ncbi:MAG TPA: hypothetical protein VF405_08890 [Gammaproteobacteria bacterium]
MAETTGNEKAQDAAEIAAAVRDRSMEQLQGAKGQLAEGAERVAAAVDRTADQLEGDGDNAISGFGHSVASLMRQLAGGLRERDVEEFARELASLARRNPGVFLAGSVALGFGIARFFRARAPQPSQAGDDFQSSAWQGSGAWQSSQERSRSARDYDAEERLDLSAHSTATQESQEASAATGSEQERNAAKARQTGKHKAKQRASSGGSEQPSPSGDGAPRGSKS